MTTKFKIITGFSVLLVLLGVMAFLGYSSLQMASNNFNDYRRLANVNVYSSDINANINEILLYSIQYIQERKPRLPVKAQARVDATLEVVVKMRERLRRQESLDSLKKAENMLLEIKAYLTGLQTNIEKLGDVYSNQGIPHMAGAMEIISGISKNAVENENIQSLYYQTVIWQNIGEVRERMMAFYAELDMAEGQALQKALAACEKNIADAGRVMLSAVGRSDFIAMQDAFRKVADVGGQMVEVGGEAGKDVAGVMELGGKMLSLASELSQVSDELMRANGSATLESNQAAQFRMLLTTVVGLVLGIAFALYTIVSLIKTLGRMSVFAGDIAAGNFNSAVRITEKGEIGTMFSAIRQIPEIFSGVMGRCNEIAGDISSGLFRNRLDAGRLSGGFAELARSINTIADSYTHTIDHLPVGIVTLDNSRKTIFSNEAGEKMVGNDAQKAFGGAIPFLDESLRGGKAVFMETALTSPEGRAVDVAATALPLKNLTGEIAGGLTVLTDISEIKNKQKLILQVANDASNVSDRVAAAAEQLAAQVEQISRGADVQRSRVESTASAMVEMNSTVMEVARNAGQAADQTEGTRSSAENGAGLVRQVVGAINDVNEIGRKLQENMQELGEKAENVGGVMGVISDIADQTNLLALNAAIEAARAGEAGRGFAVVADEVRKLAEKTMAATQEVGTNIESIQHSARVNIDEVGHAVDSVGKATELANASGGALEEIVNLASSSSAVVSSIATAAEEQSATSEEINSAIDEINRITGETATGMVQSSEAVQELSRMAQELRHIMQNLQ